MKRLIDVVPYEFENEFYDTKAYKMKDINVISTHEDEKWPGIHKNIHIFWKLENGYLVGWNESPIRGWSFPVIKNKVNKGD